MPLMRTIVMPVGTAPMPVPGKALLPAGGMMSLLPLGTSKPQDAVRDSVEAMAQLAFVVLVLPMLQWAQLVVEQPTVPLAL